MKTEFEMTLFDDAETAKNLSMLNRLEALFDHSKISLPVGSRVKITFEVIE